MQSFEQAPQATPENQRARVKPLNERVRKPRFVDPQMEEEAMPDTRRTGAARPREVAAKKEDVAKVEEIQEQIQQPEANENLQTLARYSDESIGRARNALGQLNMAMRTNALDANALQQFRTNLLRERDYLMQLQQYSILQPKSEKLKQIQEETYKNIVDIQEAVYAADMHVRERSVAQNWQTEKKWTGEERTAIRNAKVDAESAALANKFNTSAKKMEAQKKSLWGRFKSLFS